MPYDSGAAGEGSDNTPKLSKNFPAEFACEHFPAEFACEHFPAKFASEHKVVSKITYHLNCAAYAHSCLSVKEPFLHSLHNSSSG